MSKGKNAQLLSKTEGGWRFSRNKEKMGGGVPNKVMKINYIELGKRIKQVREEREISQEKLAEIAGILIQKVSEIENGKTKMKLQEFMNIADALDTTIDVLLFGK